MPTPSLILVPARFKTGKLYTPVATTSGGTVLGASGDFNVTRATAATRVNASGYIEVVASGVPRLDYYTSGGTAGCPALLVEPSGQNLALRSEEFNVSGNWALVTGGTGVLPSVTANAVISPDGTQNAETVLLNRGANNTSSDQSTLQQTITLATSGTYTFSVYAKATASGDVGKQIFLRAGSAGGLIPFTLTANWVRLTRTETALASGSNVFQIGNRGGFTNANSVSVDLWGAQLETGSVATSYIPTTTAAATRNAEVISLSGAVSGCIGQTEGTIYAEFEYKTNTAERRLIALSNGTSSDRVMIWTLSNVLYVQVEGNSVTLANPISAGYHKVAFAYQQNGVSGNLFASLDGAAVVSGTSAAFPASLTDINIGKSEDTATSAFFWNANIRALALYTTRLTNAQLQALTT